VELKNRNIHYTIKWKLLKRAKPYNCASNRCNLCLWEKDFIICKPKMATLSKRNELVSACSHNKKLSLSIGRVSSVEGKKSRAREKVEGEGKKSRVRVKSRG
jgi:hypothetical protein